MFGKITRCENIDQKLGANAEYNKVILNGASGMETLLMTDAELSRIRERANKNPEDHLSYSAIEKWCAWWCRTLQNTKRKK